MLTPRKRLYLAVVFVLASALVLEPLPIPASVSGVHIDLSSPLKAISSFFASIPDALGAAVGHVFGRHSVGAATASPTPTPSPSDGPVPDAPNEIVSKRERDAKFYRNSNGSTRAEFANNQHYLAGPGRWEDIDLTFRPDGSDEVVERNDVIIRVTGSAIIAIARGSGKGVRWLLPEAPQVSGREARFDGQGGLKWRYVTTPAGLKLLSDAIAAPLGQKTYTFSYQLLGKPAPLTVDAFGNLVNDAFMLPRAYVMGADDESYPAGAWSLGPGAGEINFDLDDATLPPSAFPYRIDPSTLFGVATSADDDWLLRSDTVYPPGGTITANTTSNRIGVAREKVSPDCAGTGSGPYCIRVGFVRFNTASLPDTATINSATLTIQVTSNTNPDNLKLYAGYYSAWPITTGATDGDYTSGTDSNASGSAWGMPSNGLKTLPLSNVLSISKTGYTGFRFNISQRTNNAAPTGENHLNFASWDATDYPNPRMTVVYNNTAPTTPTADSPLSGAALPSITPVLKALSTDAQADPIDYQFRVSSASNCSTSLASSGWLSRTNTWTVPASAGLKDGQTYYWCAMSRDSYGMSTNLWSATQSFNVRLSKLGSNAIWPMWSNGPFSVNQANGNLTMTLPGPSYPSAAGALGVSLSYNSQDSVDHGFGKGWLFDAGDELSDPPQKIIDHNLLTGSAKYDAAEVIYASGMSDYYTHLGSSNVYQSPPGGAAQLHRNPDATAPTKYTWSFIDESDSIYTIGDPANPTTSSEQSLFKVETADTAAGVNVLNYTFSGSPLRVTRISDSASHSLTLTYAGSGCTGGLICATGPDNVTWTYKGPSAAPTSTPLTSVHDGTRTLLALGYDANGLLTKIQNPNDLDPTHASPGYNATHAVTATYDAASPKRVATVSEGPVTGQTPSTSTWTFSYTPGTTTPSAPRASHATMTNCTTPRSADGFTEVTPPNQQGQPTPKKSRVFYDNLGRTMEVRDVFGTPTLLCYNERSQLAWQEMWAEGTGVAPVDYAYDPVTQALLSVTGPDPDGAGPLGRPLTTNRYDEMAIGTSSSAGPPLTGLQASYYSNRSLAGRASARQNDASVDFNWGTVGPSALGPQVDNFSIQWTANLNVMQPGTYTLSTMADDGTRLTVDGLSLIDNWTSGAVRTVSSAPISLTAGLHTLVLDYYEETGFAEVHLRWACTTCTTPISDQVIPTASLYPGWMNRTSTVDSVGRVRFNHYDKPQEGHPDYSLAKVGSSNLITSYLYDTFGRATQKVLPRGNAASTIDSSGNLARNTDTQYAITWTYYGLTETATVPAACGAGTAVVQAGLQKSIQYAGLTAETTVYDAAGRAIALTNAAGTTCSGLDTEGRLISDKAPGETASTAYTYDPSGAQRTATDSTGTVTTEYDEAGRVKRALDSYGAESTFRYDADGNMTSGTSAIGALASNPNYTTSYQYDAADQLTRVTDPAARQYSFYYDVRGNLFATQYPNTTFSWNQFNDGGWLTGLYNRHGTLSAPVPGTPPADSISSPIADYNYAYNQDGKKSQETRTGGGLSAETRSFTYDTVGRMDTTTLPDGTLREYKFDLDSNRTQIYQTPSGGVRTLIATYVYDPAVTPGMDSLSRITQGSSTTTFGYDGDGQTRSRGSDSLTWDGRGRSTGGTFSGTVVTYTFDAQGRLRQRIAGSGPSNTIQYRYTAANASVFELNGNAALQSTSIPGAAGDLASYTGAPSTSSTVSYFYYTGHGDLAAEANSSGTRTGAYTYDPFGGVQQTPASNTTVERWTGRWDKKLDTAAGIIQMGARPYDPLTGRFLAVDPIEGGSANSYDYANQEPVNMFDLSGTRLLGNDGVSGDPCDDALREIRKWYREAKRRVVDWYEKGEPYRWGTRQGHIDAMRSAQRHLRENLKFWDKWCGGGPPPGIPGKVWRVATQRQAYVKNHGWLKWSVVPTILYGIYYVVRKAGECYTLSPSCATP